MTVTIIICVLLLLAYAFDVSAAFTKIPSVILLLLLGSIVRYVTTSLNIVIPDLNPFLPVLGTIGLILIVLEGSLDLEINRSKIPMIKKSVLVAIIPMFVMAFGLAFLLGALNDDSFKLNLINVIPFCVISSAIAIPSVRGLSQENKEFVVYETSLSDIFGVLFFNFIALNPYINGQSFGLFGIQILSRIRHHVTFTPIILFVILIYAVSKEFHLPGLIFILVFGLFLGNIDELKRFKWIEKFRPLKLQAEVDKFKEVTIEATFMVRATFFILFGFLMTSPLLFVAPRGLITILLFLAIVPEQSIPLVNKSLVIQTVLLSVVAMMIGLMTTKKEEPTSEEDNKEAAL